MTAAAFRATFSCTAARSCRPLFPHRTSSSTSQLRFFAHPPHRASSSQGAVRRAKNASSLRSAAALSTLRGAVLSSAGHHRLLAGGATARHRHLSTVANGKVEYLCVHVFVTVKPGTEDAFKAASLANARASSLEAGVARFDVVQQIDDPTKFVLIEVYKTADAPAAHKETEHYNTWRETVADMMAVPRSAIKYKNIFPSLKGGWDYAEGKPLE